MTHDYEQKLARVLTEYSQPIEPGQIVSIRTNTLAIPAVEALVEAVLRRGGNPVVRLDVPSLADIMYEIASDEQLAFFSPDVITRMETVDVAITLRAITNAHSMMQVDPARAAIRQRAMKPLMDIYRERRKSGDLRWVGTVYPTEASAQQAETSLRAFRAFAYRACGFDQPDPVAYWQGVREKQQRLVDWLNGKEQIEVRGPGVDLNFSVAGRTWVNCDGTVNFPDGEVFTGPVEDSMNGHIHYSFKTTRMGRTVEGVKLAFKDGVVTEVSATKGEDYLLAQLDMDEGARRIGEFAIGTNYGIQQVTGDTLFDEKIGGTIHMALGYSIPESGGVNQSALHWDIVHDMKNGGEIHADGELFYKDGQFVI